MSQTEKTQSIGDTIVDVAAVVCLAAMAITKVVDGVMVVGVIALLAGVRIGDFVINRSSGRSSLPPGTSALILSLGGLVAVLEKAVFG